jgi:hypothetical protein
LTPLPEALESSRTLATPVGEISTTLKTPEKGEEKAHRVRKSLEEEEQMEN